MSTYNLKVQCGMATRVDIPVPDILASDVVRMLVPTLVSSRAPGDRRGGRGTRVCAGSIQKMEA